MARKKANRGRKGRSKKRGAGSKSRVRDAITGQFLKRGTEKRRPKTTVVERIEPKRKR